MIFGPESVFWEPGSETFINVSFWELFWRPRAGKVRFGPKKLEISPQNRIFLKNRFCAKSWDFAKIRKCSRNLTISALKRLSKSIRRHLLGNAGAKSTKKVCLELCSGPKIAEIHISLAPYKHCRILILLEARCGRRVLESIKRYK